MRPNKNCEPRDDWISHSSQSWLWLAWNQGFPRKLPVRGMLTAPLATTQGSLGQPKLRMDLQDIHSFISWPTADKAASFTKDPVSSPITKEDVGEWIPVCPSLEATNKRTVLKVWDRLLEKGTLKEKRLWYRNSECSRCCGCGFWSLPWQWE